MRTSLIVAAALAAGANGAAIEARQRPRPTTTARPGVIDRKASPAEKRDPQISLAPPRPSVTFWPNDPGSVEKCGLDAFIGHTSEALLFCSSILKGGTATETATITSGSTITTRTTVITTLYPPSTSARPSSTVRPPTSTPRPPTSTPPTSTPRPPTSTPRPPTSSPVPPSSTKPTPPSSAPPSSSPAPTTTPPPGASCGIVGYTKNVAAYYFDSSGTQNTWKACGDKCKADTKCKSWGYGEANCMLFDVPASENTNYNPMSPYTFYDQSCPEELPVKKRQVQISIGLPGGSGGISSACSCLITSAPAGTTRTTTVTTSVRTTKTETVTRTVSLFPDSP